MGPLARVVPKALFPLVTRDGSVRPLLHFILEQAVSAGAERIGVVVAPGQAEMVRTYLAAVDGAEDSDFGDRVTCIAQPSAEGFGDAVARGREFIDDEPFLLLLGDYVYLDPPGGPRCAGQVAAAFAERGGAAVVGMQPVSPEVLPRCGVARGEPLDDRLYRCTALVEKPSLRTARERLVTPDLPEDRFLAHAGVYAFSPALFDCLGDPTEAGGEVQLADAQVRLLERAPDEYLLLRIEGEGCDCGTPEGYAAAQRAFRPD
jgi:UTP--glucose-1-phosphate uridylyltransferase